MPERGALVSSIRRLVQAVQPAESEVRVLVQEREHVDRLFAAFALSPLDTLPTVSTRRAPRGGDGCHVSVHV